MDAWTYTMYALLAERGLEHAGTARLGDARHSRDTRSNAHHVIRR